jgi:hypothetical protein
VATNPGPEFIVDDAYQLAFGESMVFVVEGQAESQWRGAFVVMYEPVETSKATPILSLELNDWLEHGPGTLTRLAQESEAEKEWLENPEYDTSFADDAWTKTLSKNGKIQLLALSLPGKGSGFWWSPQGAPVANARGFSKMNSNSLGSVGVRVWEPGFDRCFLNEGEGRSIGNQADFEDHFSETEQSQLAILGFEAAELNTSKRLRLGAGFGEWSPFAEIPFESNTATIVNGANLQLWPIYDAQDNMATHAWAIITCPAQEKVNLDFTAVAITKDGRELPNVCNPTVYFARPDGTTQLIFDAPAAEIKSLAIKSRPIYWVTFEGFSLKPAKKTEVNVSVETPLNTYESIQADLPTGLRVQLAGVTTPIIITEDLVKKGVSGAFAPLPTADKPDKRQWWSGEGLKLDMAPEPGRSWMVRKEWEDGRQFAFEISGLPDSDSELNVVMFHDRATEPQQAVMIEVSKSQLDPGKRIILGSIAPNADAASATLELRIGTGKSATVKFDTDGKRIDSLADDAALHSNSMKQIIANIKFLRIVQNGENVEVWTRPITTNGQLGSVRYSVVDKTGTSHSSPGGYSMNDVQLTPFKNLSVANIREVHFEIRAFDHSVMFENVSRKPGTRSEVKVTVAPLPKPPEPIQVRLPNNETIELLGVSTPPIELLPSQDKREWWKGDGSKMEAAPIPMGSISVGASESDGREFVVRASNLAGQVPLDVTLKERFKDGQLYKPDGNGWSQSSTHSGPIDENHKDKFQVTSEYVAGPVGDADSATLEVRVGSGVNAEMLFDSNGQRPNGDSKEAVWQLAAVKKMAERVEVLRTGPHEAGFAIWTKPFSSTTDEGTLDVTLIDASGQRHNRFTSGSDGNEAYHVFEIQPDEIDKFVVRLRPYQYVATFENVSLKPGVKSDVKASVASLLAEKAPVVDVPAASNDKADGEKASEPPFDAESNADIFQFKTENDPSEIRLRGLILNARNEPIPNATVCVVIVDTGDEKDRVAKIVKSDGDGSYQIPIPKEWAMNSHRRHEIWAAAEGHQIEVAQLLPLDADSKPWDQQQCTLRLADASDYAVQIVGNAWADVETMSLVTPHEYVIRTEKNGTEITDGKWTIPRESKSSINVPANDDEYVLPTLNATPIDANP